MLTSVDFPSVSDRVFAAFRLIA